MHVTYSRRVLEPSTSALAVLWVALLVLLAQPVAAQKSHPTPAAGSPAIFDVLSTTVETVETRGKEKPETRAVTTVRMRDVARSLAKGQVSIPLARDKSVEFQASHHEVGAEDLEVFSGFGFDGPEGLGASKTGLDHVFIATRGDYLRGEVATEEHQYVLRSVGDGLVEIERREWTDEGSAAAPSDDRRAVKDPFVAFDAVPSPLVTPPLPVTPVTASTAGEETTSSGSEAASSVQTIDVLVAFTQAAANKSSDELLDAIAAASFTNQVYGNSGVNSTLRVSGTAVVPYSESGWIPDDLTALKLTSDGRMDELHSLRDATNSDIVVLIADYVGGFNGAAYGAIYTSDPDGNAFAVVAYEDMLTGTFPHEVGHVHGADHNVENSTWTFEYEFAHGKRRSRPFGCPVFICGSSWRTVMSYGDQRRIPYFSDPDLTYDGQTIGDATTEDNVRTHRLENSTVAAFRAAPAPPLSASLSGPPSVPAFSFGTWRATVNGGSNPSHTYTWSRGPSLSNLAVVQNGGRTYSASVTADDFYLRFNVVNGAGETASSTIFVDVTVNGGCQPLAEGPATADIPICPQVARDPKTGLVLYDLGPEDGVAQAPGGPLPVAPALRADTPAEDAVSVFPQPVNSQGTVVLDVRETGAAVVAVYDVQGRRVRSLVDGPLEAGTHRVRVDASGLAAGIYVVVLDTPRSRTSSTLVVR